MLSENSSIDSWIFFLIYVPIKGKELGRYLDQNGPTLKFLHLQIWVPFYATILLAPIVGS
jgi:hypothetical protein